MNIMGGNTLACTLGIDDCKGDAIKIYPLPHMPVLKDLVPDLTSFFAQYASIEPWLQTQTPSRRPNGARRPRSAPKLDGLYECILVRLLYDLVPELLVERGPVPRPGSLLQAYRWLIDSRDEATGERLDGCRIRSGSTAATRS